MIPLKLTDIGGPKRKKADNDAELLFLFQVKATGLPFPICQHRFAQCIGREWRFDFAWPAHKIALEVQGGIWIKGAHADPKAILRNMEKQNYAALLGWRQFQFSPDQVKSGGAIKWMQQYFEENPL
jgi:hypothetical protein